LNCYIISYDLLKADSHDYESLYEAIKSYGTWANITESTWAIVTDKNSKQVRDDLGQNLKSGDRLFVLKSSGIAAWRNAICKNEWLKENL
jgi:uncharacterized Zn ribbon protein